jgi:hypothetical protein
MFSLTPFYRRERYWFLCHTCRKRHEESIAHAGHLAEAFNNWKRLHPEPRCVAVMMGPDQVEAMARRHEKVRKRFRKSVLNYSHNANVKLALGTETSAQVTALNSLASSATAGWSSGYIDNTTNLYLEYFTYLKLAAVNTAPANNQAFYVFGAGANNLTNFPSTGATTSGTVKNGVIASNDAAMNFPTIATGIQILPLLFNIPYVAQNVIITTPSFGMARAYGGMLPSYLWYGLINYSGMTIAASGNVVAYTGVYSTIA